MTLMYVSPRNEEWSLKTEFESSFSFPWGSKKSQSALELPVVCATAPFLSLRGKELDAPAVVVGTSSFATRCKVGGWWVRPHCLCRWKARGSRRIVLCLANFMVLRKGAPTRARAVGSRQRYCIWDLSWSPWAPCSLSWGCTSIALGVLVPFAADLPKLPFDLSHLLHLVL